MKTYRYHGPATSATLRLPSGELLDIILSPGGVADLPDDHEYTLELIRLGRLVELPPSPPGPPAKGKKQNEENAA